MTMQEIEEAFLNQHDLMLAELHVKVLRSLLQREDITYNKEVDVRCVMTVCVGEHGNGFVFGPVPYTFRNAPCIINKTYHHSTFFY